MQFGKKVTKPQPLAFQKQRNDTHWQVGFKKTKGVNLVGKHLPVDSSFCLLGNKRNNFLERRILVFVLIGNSGDGEEISCGMGFKIIAQIHRYADDDVFGTVGPFQRHMDGLDSNGD